MQIARAAAAYWAMIFVLGFALGTLRVMWGAQALGETGFILIEVPIMLLASWLAAKAVVRRFAVQPGRAALAMGALAFALLMAAEVTLTAILGGDPAAWLAGLIRPPGLYGFIGQLAFGLMPWLAARKSAAS